MSVFECVDMLVPTCWTTFISKLGMLRSFSVTQNFQDDTAELGSTARNPNNINSVLYALLTVNFFAAGVGYLYAPTATLEVSPRASPS